MTVQTLTQRKVHFGNDVATEFSFSDFDILDEDDLVVSHFAIDGTETTLVKGTGTANYSVTGSFPGTGSITYPASGSGKLATGEILVIERIIVPLQEVDLNNNGDYDANVVERMVDRVVMYQQQLDDATDRSLKVSKTDTSGASFELPTPQAGRTIGVWNDEGTAMEIGPTASEISSAQANAASAAASAATALSVTSYLNRNLLINGGFSIWQRGTNFTSTGYSADRWYCDDRDGTFTISRQAFAVGQTDVPGNPSYFLRYNMTAGTTTLEPTLIQRIEDVTRYSGVSITIGFYAKVASGTLSVTPNLIQNFGSGGSSNVDAAGSSLTVTTSWQKFEQTIVVPSVSGKTVGAGNYLSVQLHMPAAATFQIDFANIKVEEGSVSSLFILPEITSELVDCQRYYQKSYSLDVTPGAITTAGALVKRNVWASALAGSVLWTIKLPVIMRGAPTLTFYSTNTGSTGVLYDAVAGADVLVTSTGTNDGGFNVYNSAAIDATSTNFLYTQYTAEAEL